jgi:hypothetical protein
MLFRYTAYCLFFLGSIISYSSAQQLLRGKIYNAKGDEVLVAVTILDRTNKELEISDLVGNYNIRAAEGDTVIFSSVTYFPDTVIVSFFMLNAGFDVSMQPHETTLSPVIVNGFTGYQVDSLNRREYYKDYYRQKKLVNDSFPSAGFGVHFSVFDYFSGKEKRKRKFTERLDKDEMDYYIDYRFSANYVSKLTGLKNDSLKTFMKLYRPAYKFCRKASQQDMLFYINDKMKIFMKRS